MLPLLLPGLPVALCVHRVSRMPMLRRGHGGGGTVTADSRTLHLIAAVHATAGTLFTQVG